MALITPFRPILTRGGGTALTAIDNYTFVGSDQTLSYGDGLTFTAYAQSFTGDGSNIGAAIVKIAAQSAGNCYLEIYAHSGVFGTSSVPTGAALATSDIIDGSLLLEAANYKFTFTGAQQITLTAATNYCLVLRSAAASGVFLYANNAGAHGGNLSRTDGTWAALDTWDMGFTILPA